MFWLIAALLFLGLMLMLMEIVLPYGVSFTVGLLSAAGSVWLCRSAYPDYWVFYTVGASLLAVAMAWGVLKKGAGVMLLKPPPSSGPSSASRNKSWPEVGETVEVVQPLHPTGTVRWQGRRLAARGLHPERECAVGAQVVVKGRDSIYLLVAATPDDEVARPS